MRLYSVITCGMPQSAVPNPFCSGYISATWQIAWLLNTCFLWTTLGSSLQGDKCKGLGNYLIAHNVYIGDGIYVQEVPQISSLPYLKIMSVKPFRIAHKSIVPLASILAVAASKEKGMINLIKRAFNCPAKEFSILVYNLQARETF